MKTKKNTFSKIAAAIALFAIIISIVGATIISIYNRAHAPSPVQSTQTLTPEQQQEILRQIKLQQDEQTPTTVTPNSDVKIVEGVDESTKWDVWIVETQENISETPVNNTQQ